MKPIKLDEALLDKVNTMFSDTYKKHMIAYLNAAISDVEASLTAHIDPEDLAYDYKSLYKLHMTLAYFDASCRETILNDIVPDVLTNASFMDKLNKHVTPTLFTDLTVEPTKDNAVSDNLKHNVGNKLKDTFDALNNSILDNTNDNSFTSITDPFDGHTPYFNMTVSNGEIESAKLKDWADLINMECDYADQNIRAIHDQARYNNKFGANTSNLNKPINEIYTKDFTNALNNYKDTVEKKPLPELTLNLEADKKGLEKYEMVNSPKHYNTYSVEVIDMFERIYGPARTADWCEMTALKYRMRMGTKPDNSINQDLDKEQWYLKKAKELRAKVEE